MADAAVGTVINKLTKLAEQEVQLLLQVVKDVKFIADKFEWLQALLNDAEQKRRTSKNPFVALWIKQARDTTFEMEDVLDDFSRKVEEVRLPCYGSWKDVLKFGWATDCFTRVVVKHGLSSKIENIKIKLAMLEEDKQTYGLDLNPSSSSWIPSLDKTIPTWAKEDYSKTLVGLDSQAQELIAQLKDGADQERKVISIVGDRGSGTVMLAKKVYDSSEIQSHFEVGAWKNLPQKFRLKETLADIYFKILEQEGKVEEDCTHKGDMGKMLEQEGKVEEDSTREDDVMGKALLGLLKNRRYLIVLNGLDNLACWKKVILSQYLPDDKNGSRIILIPKIGSEFSSLSYIDGVTAFEQKLSFNSNDSIELFLQRFPEKYVYLRKYGEYIRQIYGVTNGHPMTIVLLAGLLGSKDEVSDWEEVFTYLKASKNGYRTYQTMLSLCFDDLPHQLKSCLMYFAAVPQTIGIEASQLVRRWIAEGLVQPKSGRKMEEVAEGYLKELISRSLVRIEEKDEFGGPAVVAIDGPIHSFLQSEAEESSFFEIHDNTDLVSPTKVRRLSIQNYTQKQVQINNSLPKLRTLLCDCSETTVKSEPHQMRFLLKSNYLRVLDLHGINIKRLPNGISSMMHLRYLGIRCSTFDALPYSIGRLQNLQTLDIRKSSVKSVPDSFWRIPTLRHILSDRVKLPKNIREHIHLQTLQTADCTNWNHKKYQLLENISNIQILKLEELSTDQAENIQKAFNKLAFLRHLSLKVREGNHISIKIFTMGSLLSLQSMELHGQLHDLEKEVKDFSFRYCMPNLVILTLIMSKLGQKIMDYLSELPSLTKLRLLKSYNEKNIKFHPNGFQNLQELKLSGLNELEEWEEVSEGALPKLKNLILIGCPKFKSFPKGLQNLKLLEEISVYNMDEIIKGIREKTGDNYEKIKHVKTIKLRRDSSVDYSSNGNVYIRID